MSNPPDWQDGECCYRCRAQFTLVSRKHHCRNCGNIFCAKCSSQQIPLPKLNIDKSVRVCDGCYEKLSKEEDSISLALNKTTDQTQSSSKSSKSGTNKTEKTSKSTGKASVNSASAPSEQELKEEEELQLALALSLSEAPTKIKFPDCSQFEEPTTSSQNQSTDRLPSNNGTSTSKFELETKVTQANNSLPQPTSEFENRNSYTSVAEKQPQVSLMQSSSYAPESSVQTFQSTGQDDELFRFVAECQSTAEVFTNRLNSAKLRNRPVSEDPAIQSLFLKLTNMHSKVLEYITTYNDERSGYESVQDKLSQVYDARAALDLLREEHQEKIRQEAAEAERLRQSQLASKLEMMRQKKSQMMQYQKELALQRIQAQEMLLRQQSQAYQTSVPLQQPTVSLSHLNSVPVPPQQPVQQVSGVVPQAQELVQHQPQLQSNTMISQTPISQPSSNLPQIPQLNQQPVFHTDQGQFIQHAAQNIQPVQQPIASTLPTSRPEDDTPLISFDD